MKKIINLLLLTVVTVFLLTSCSSGENVEQPTTDIFDGTGEETLETSESADTEVQRESFSGVGTWANVNNPADILTITQSGETLSFEATVISDGGDLINYTESSALFSASNQSTEMVLSGDSLEVEIILTNDENGDNISRSTHTRTYFKSNDVAVPPPIENEPDEPDEPIEPIEPDEDGETGDLDEDYYIDEEYIEPPSGGTSAAISVRGNIIVISITGKAVEIFHEQVSSLNLDEEYVAVFLHFTKSDDSVAYLDLHYFDDSEYGYDGGYIDDIEYGGDDEWYEGAFDVDITASTISWTLDSSQISLDREDLSGMSIMMDILEYESEDYVEIFYDYYDVEDIDFN